MRQSRTAVLALPLLLLAAAASAASTSFGTLAVADNDFARTVAQGITMASAQGSDLNAHAELRVLNHQLSTSRRLLETLRDLEDEARRRAELRLRALHRGEPGHRDPPGRAVHRKPR